MFDYFQVSDNTTSWKIITFKCARNDLYSKNNQFSWPLNYKTGFDEKNELMRQKWNNDFPQSCLIFLPHSSITFRLYLGWTEAKRIKMKERDQKRKRGIMREKGGDAALEFCAKAELFGQDQSFWNHSSAFPHCICASVWDTSLKS